MNAMLEKELAGLTLQEKAEVIDYLLPEVVSADAEISGDLLGELERRDIALEANPASGIMLGEFERQLFKRK